MAVYTKNISEVLFFRETARKNLHTANVTETLQLTQRLRSNIKILRIHENIRLFEAVRRVGGIHNLSISESLSFLEKLHPRVYVYNVSESVLLIEMMNSLTIGDKLVMVEAVTYQLIKTISDNLVIEESLTFTANRNLPIAESLTLIESLTAAVFPSQGAVTTPDDEDITTNGEAVQEMAIGTIDGTNAIFNVSFAPVNLKVYINGTFTTAYTLAGTQITFTTAPAIGSNIFANYFKS